MGAAPPAHSSPESAIEEEDLMEEDSSDAGTDSDNNDDEINIDDEAMQHEHTAHLEVDDEDSDDESNDDIDDEDNDEEEANGDDDGDAGLGAQLPQWEPKCQFIHGQRALQVFLPGVASRDIRFHLQEGSEDGTMLVIRGVKRPTAQQRPRKLRLWPLRGEAGPRAGRGGRGACKLLDGRGPVKGSAHRPPPAQAEPTPAPSAAASETAAAAAAAASETTAAATAAAAEAAET